jgi:hypothetical protein
METVSILTPKGLTWKTRSSSIQGWPQEIEAEPVVLGSDNRTLFMWLDDGDELRFVISELLEAVTDLRAAAP